MLIIFSNLISLISVNTIVILYKGSICKYYFTLGSFLKKIIEEAQKNRGFCVRYSYAW